MQSSTEYIWGSLLGKCRPNRRLPSPEAQHISHRSTFPIPSMNTSDYPGKDLSLSQLAYALNEQLKRTANPPLYVERKNPARIRQLTASSASPWTQSLNSNATFQPHLQPSMNGRTASLESTASQSISSASSPPTFLLKRTDLFPLLCAVIGAGSSFNMERYGPSCCLWRTRTMWQQCSSVQKGPRWT